MEIQDNYNRFLPSHWHMKDTLSNQAFVDYIAKVATMIAKNRCDLATEQAQAIISANSPFELLPQNSGVITKKRGVLLIHGGLGSPFDMRDFGHYFQQQGFLVRSVLLPGCGTRPADLLTATQQDWIATVDYGIASFTDQVDELYLLGFSLGGALALRYALLNPTRIKKLILIAPCLQLKTKLSPLLPLLNKAQQWLKKPFWVVKGKDNDYARYDSFPLSFVNEVRSFCVALKKIRHQKSLQCPLFTVISDADQVINSKTVEHYMAALKNIDKRLIIYSSDKNRRADGHSVIRNSYFAEKNILDFSHTSMHISPDNLHYGQQGDYRDFRHYYSYPKPNNLEKRSVYYGSPSLYNLRKYSLENLSYNPDYAFLLESISHFISE